MARIDDYIQAIDLARKDLAQKDPKTLANLTKGQFFGEGGEGLLRMSFLNKSIRVSWPGLSMVFEESGEELSLQQQVLLNHYLLHIKETRPKGQWVSFQDIPDCRFYMDAFIRRAKQPLVKAFGQEPERLLEIAADMYSAKKGDQGDISVVLEALPNVPVMLLIWKGDEEFPPEGGILFDITIGDLLSAEDIAWLAGMVIYPLVGQKARMQKGA